MVVEIFFEGTLTQQQNAVVVDGTRCGLQNAPFLVLLRLAVCHLRKPGHPVDGGEVGLVKKSDKPKKIRGALRDALPEGVDILVSHGAGTWALHKSVKVRANWEALEEHPTETVKKIARGQRGHV